MKLNMICIKLHKNIFKKLKKHVKIGLLKLLGFKNLKT